jgi:hypothetical protein
MEGGILKCGNIFLANFLNYYFIIVNGTGGASLYVSGVELEFVSAMNSVVYILGGMVTLKYVKLNKQNMFWVSPLVSSDSSTSSVIVNLHSCTITNCKYQNAVSSIAKSAVVYFINRTNGIYSITLNMSSCLCQNNIFHLGYVDDWGGGFGLFYSWDVFSSMSFFF